MKTIVSIQQLVELEIKPNAQLQQYYALTEREVRARWGDGRTLVTVACPACGDSGSAGVFDRWGFVYRDCASCGTLYVTARPTDAELADYFRESEPARFWRNTVAAMTADARREKVVLPRVEWVLDSLAEYLPEAGRLVDVSSNPGMFLHVLNDASETPRELIAAGPLADLDVGTESGGRIAVRPSLLPQAIPAGSADVVTAFDVLDRCSNVRLFVDSVRDALAPGGLAFFGMPTSSGFEVQVLWDRSPTMVPPDKLNVLSIDGLMRLFHDGWEILELSTPGLLDVEVVTSAMKRGEPVPRFVRRLLSDPAASTIETFVEFLQRNRMASVARLLVRRL